jgi:alpha-methylacyl-CoA racemase
MGPGPFCALMLADHGADVIRIDRPGVGPSATPVSDPRAELLHRNRRSMELDLKAASDLTIMRQLIGKADVLLEGNRPGVMERLGLGPKDCEELNPRLIYGRMTGWGQDGPYSGTVGHDLNYLSISGTLSPLGPARGTSHGSTGHPG